VRKNETTNDLFTAASELLGTGLAGTIAHTFRCMEIAEEEIAAAKAQHPLLAAPLHDGFRELCPPSVLREAGEPLYRAYCREVLARIAAGQALAPATTAELLAVLQAMSLAARSSAPRRSPTGIASRSCSPARLRASARRPVPLPPTATTRCARRSSRRGSGASSPVPARTSARSGDPRSEGMPVEATFVRWTARPSLSSSPGALPGAGRRARLGVAWVVGLELRPEPRDPSTDPRAPEVATRARALPLDTACICN
jgi:hypothetical protein